MIRLGVKPKGIFASGMIERGSHEDLHWESDKAAAGETIYFVNVRLDTLLNPDTDSILPRELLNASPFSEMHWDTRMSGVQIPEKAAEQLEMAWASFTNATNFVLP